MCTPSKIPICQNKKKWSHPHFEEEDCKKKMLKFQVKQRKVKNLELSAIKLIDSKQYQRDRYNIREVFTVLNINDH